MKKAVPKRRYRIKTLIPIFLLLAIMGALWLFQAIPQKDTIQRVALPQEFTIDANQNYIDLQAGNECSAYAAAYVMRHLGSQITGSDLYSDIHRIFGFVPVHYVVSLFQSHGYCAKAYHGNIDTMKGRLTNGVPIIAFVSIPGDTHYVVVVGYDEDFIYLVDSISDYSNADGSWYNRKLSIKEFEEIWKTSMYPVKNIYIVVYPQ